MERKFPEFNVGILGLPCEVNCPKFPENQDNRKILFHSSHGIPKISNPNFWLNGVRPQFLEPPNI